MNSETNIADVIMRFLKEPENKVASITVYEYKKGETHLPVATSYRGKDVGLFISKFKEESLRSLCNMSISFEQIADIQIVVFINFDRARFSNTAAKIDISAWRQIPNSAISTVVLCGASVLNLDIDSSIKKIMIDNLTSIAEENYDR